jgi:hypothetical protein
MQLKKIYRKSLLLFFAVCIFSKTSRAWGPEGHAIVGRIAMQFVSEDVRKNVLAILGDMPVDTAANWMDIVRSNPDYDFMKTWHYLDFPKGQEFIPGVSDNIVNRLLLTFNELKHRKILCTDQVRMDLLVLMHLIGDLHMPLHTGYEDDLGGNKRMIQFDTLKTHNLHTFWDIDIISFGNITDGDCLQYLSNLQKDTMHTVDFFNWMKESRSLLDRVYDFPDFTISNEYLIKNKKVVEKQLLLAGLRLALVLNKLFYSVKKLPDFKTLVSKQKNGINSTDALQNVGKKVTVCERIYSIRATASITQISVGASFPNNPLTVIIFAKNYSNFKQPIEEWLRDKDICVKGTIELYKGKPQIIIEKPDDLEIIQ